ncbi:unnamed protein product, partial [Symbiodinium sp. KB8]
MSDAEPSDWSKDDLMRSQASVAVSMLASGDYAGAAIDWRSTPRLKRPRIKRAVFETKQGPVDFYGFAVGADGLQVTTEGGEIMLQELNGLCDPQTLGVPGYGLTVSTSRGSIQL